MFNSFLIVFIVVFVLQFELSKQQQSNNNRIISNQQPQGDWQHYLSFCIVFKGKLKLKECSFCLKKEQILFVSLALAYLSHNR
jgi:hypothetical protein